LPNSARILHVPATPCDHRHQLFRVAWLPNIITKSLSCYTGCIKNELVALHNRHLVRLAEPDYRTVSAVGSYWVSNFPKWKNYRHWTQDEVIQHTMQAKRKRTIDAFRAYSEQGHSRSDERIRMFIKHEKAEDDPDDPPEFKSPRGIQYRSFKHTALFKTVLGPFEMRLWRLGQNWEQNAPSAQRMFSKNMNPRAVARNLREAWDEFADPVADLWDARKLDAHMGELVRELIEFPTYRKGTYGFDPYIQPMKCNKCRSKNGIVYEMNYTMCSGEACTSCGDSIVVAAMAKYAYRHIKHRLIVCGDDSVIIRERLSEPEWDVFTKCGFSMKLEQAHMFEQVEFCQCRPVNVNGVWTMVRNPNRVLNRSIHCIKNFGGSDTAYKDWMASVGVGELESGAGVPIIQEMALRLMECGKPRAHFVSEYLQHRRTLKQREPVDIDIKTRHSFWLAWGWTPDEQLRVESLLHEGVVYQLA